MKKNMLIITLVVLALLLLLPVIYFSYCNATYMGKENEATISYLLKHKYVINADDIQIPDSLGNEFQTGRNHVFIFGETHGFSPTHLMDSQLLIYLNKERDVRAYGAEIFSQDACQLNKILNSNRLDEKLLISVISDIAKDTPQSKTVDCLKKWKSIYFYNWKADANHKIYVIGLLGDKQSYADSLRDETMAHTLLTFMNDSANADIVKNGCYCFVGLTHAFQTPYLIRGREIPTMGSILKEHLVSVTSMVQIAIDSYCYLPKNDEMISPPDESTKLVSSNGPISYFNNIVNLKKASEGVSTAVYSLDGKNSPFWDCNDLVGYKASVPFFGQPYKGKPSYSTLDYFQYVFLIRNHQAPKSI